MGWEGARETRKKAKASVLCFGGEGTKGRCSEHQSFHAEIPGKNNLCQMPLQVKWKQRSTATYQSARFEGEKEGASGAIARLSIRCAYS